MMSLVLAIPSTQLAPIDGRIEVTAQSDAKVALAYVRTSVSVKSINNPKDYKDFAGSSDERQRNLDLHNSQRTACLQSTRATRRWPWTWWRAPRPQLRCLSATARRRPPW